MTQEQPRPPKQDKVAQAQSPEQLIVQNGLLVEELFQSKAWNEIVKPLLDEFISSVSGRFTNGRYWHGTLTKEWKAETPLFLAGYQKALMDFHNSLHDFVVAKNKISEEKKKATEEATGQVYNPFLEEGKDGQG